MFDISENLKEKMTDLNNILNKNYEITNNISKKSMKDFIVSNLGNIEIIPRMSITDLKKYSEKGGIVGVDGSKNKIGGAYPHFVELFQGLAKSTIKENEPIYAADFYTALYLEREMDIIEQMTKDNPTKEEIDSFIKNYKLSGIEVDVAIKAAKELNPYIMMMDGSLIRYKIECPNKWTKLKCECEERGILLIGVIKDIKTNIIGREMIEKGIVPANVDYLYDRELLFGILEYGEMIEINQESMSKYEEGLSSCFIRTSKQPTVIGMDILNSQSEHIKEMARLVFTLTPEGSRGVPLWLDIVDSEVKISDRMMNGLLEKYIDRDILEKLFISERSKRTL